MSARVVFVWVLWMVVFAGVARAQCSPHWVPEGIVQANAIPGMIVRASVVLPGGDVLLGGLIPGARNGVSWNNIVRYRPATHQFFPCGGGVTGAQGSAALAIVEALAIDSSGQVYVGGNFANAGGAPAAFIARFDPVSDTWTALPGGPEGPVRGIAFSTNGNVAVTGNFATISSSLNFVGPAAVYSPFLHSWNGIGSGLLSVYAYEGGRVVWGTTGDIYVYIDGDISFPPFPGELHRYNPVTGVWTTVRGFTPGSHDMVGLPGGDLAISSPGDGFDAFGVQRYSPGTGVFTPIGATNAVSADALRLLPDGSLLSVGYFGGQPGLAKYNFGTGAWTGLTTSLTVGVIEAHAAVATNGDIFVVSESLVSGINSPNHVHRYLAAQAAWEVPIGVAQAPAAMALLPGGDVVVGGGMTQVGGGIAVGSIARFHPADGTWLSMGGVGVNGVVKALTVLPGGDVLVGGRFTTANGMAVNRVARYTPSTNSWSGVGSGVSGGAGSVEVNAFAVLATGEVIVGGHFTSPGRNIAKYNPATNVWSSIGSIGATSPPSVAIGQLVNALAVGPNGDVYVGGVFDRTPGAPAAGNVGRYIPSTNTWSPMGAGTDGEVLSIVLAPTTGDVLFGGDFAVVNDTIQAFYVARWRPSDSTWSAAGQSPVARLARLAALSTGDILAVGSFQSLQDSRYAAGMARLNPTTFAWSNELGLNFNAPIPGSGTCAIGTPDGGFYLGGQFVEADDLQGAVVQANNFAKFGCPAMCRADFNSSGSLSVQDIFDYLTAWFSGSPGADFNGTNGLNAQDIFDFLGAWIAGC